MTAEFVFVDFAVEIVVMAVVVAVVGVLLVMHHGDALSQEVPDCSVPGIL